MRIPKIAGSWYPSDAASMRANIDAWSTKLPHIAALFVPHAGHFFSGDIACRAYSRVDASRYNKVIILCPAHRVYMHETFSVEPAGEVATPLGNVKFSEELNARLRALPFASYVPQAHPDEHAIDIHLPFIREFFPHCELGAMIVGNFDAVGAAAVQKLATFGREFRKILDDKTLVVISTDFTHYGNNYGYIPFVNDKMTRLKKLDTDMFLAFASNSNLAFSRALNKTRATVCGASCMHLLLATLPPNAKFTRIEWANSSAKNGDLQNNVGYASGYVEASWSDPLKDFTSEVVPAFAELSQEAGKALVELARHSLKVAVLGEAYAGEWDASESVLNELLQHRGAFVTINKNGHLRGCIGEILPSRPLVRVVAERAVNSALNDQRFTPVTPDEVEFLSFDVSVLTPPKRVSGYGEVVLGRDGIILEFGGRSAVFLPQVAPENGWNLETTLTQLSLKAGLSANAWQENGAVFHTFCAQVFK